MKTIRPGMQARLIDGSVALVSDVLIDRATHEARFVVLCAHGYFGPDVLAPIGEVWRVDDAVHLALTMNDVLAMPRYDHFMHSRAAGLCSRAAWMHGASRQPSQRPTDATAAH